TDTEVTSDISNAVSKSHQTFHRNKPVFLVTAFKTRTVSITKKVLSNLNGRRADQDLFVQAGIRKILANIRKYLCGD
ncbi:hypothetical protein, partial [Gluconobacter thailandicus]